MGYTTSFLNTSFWKYMETPYAWLLGKRRYLKTKSMKLEGLTWEWHVLVLNGFQEHHILYYALVCLMRKK